MITNNKNADKFVIRTPLLPLSKLIKSEEELLKAYESQVVRDALFLASEDLYSNLIKLESNKLSDNRKRSKTIVSLYKYYARMCTRCTPFGYFSGISVGKIEKKTSIHISEKFSANIRLDMEYMCNLHEELINDAEFRKKLFYFPNNSLYKLLDKWRYVEYQIRDHAANMHNLVAIDDSPIIEKIISDGENGLSFTALTELVMDFGFEKPESEDYIHELIQNQILHSHIYPSLTGTEYSRKLFTELEKLDPEKYYQLNDRLDNILKSEIPVPDKMEKTAELLSIFETKINIKRLIQVDILKESSGSSISYELKKQIEEVTMLLSGITGESRTNNTLNKFKTAYMERYETNFMPLAEVLDSDIGIGYKEAVSSGTFNNSSVPLNLREINAFKLKVFSRAIKMGVKSIDISETELKQFENKSVKDPAASYLFFGSILTVKDGVPKIMYKNAGGSSALNIISRFGHLHTEIEDFCIALANQEENNFPNALIAEIVHMPQGKVGNILSRPQFRNYEIPYIGNSTLPVSQQININDLYIGLINGNMILLSKKHNKQVIPRLSTAHNYSRDSLPIYHFLCDLQSQQINPMISWSWDELYDQFFLPRITYKDIILSPARWNIETTVFNSKTFETDVNSFFEVLKTLELPDKFIICQGDNNLYIDLQTSPGRLTFLSFCKKNEKLILEEFPFDSDIAPDGYANEIAIPFTFRPKNNLPELKGLIKDYTAKAIFSPLSECIYLKIYAGNKFAEKLLLEVIPQLVSALNKTNIISKWFFIRYHDPKHHLRLRFFLKDNINRDLLFSILNKHLDVFVSNQLISDLQIGTYKRELERYGNYTIDECEEWFFHNSNMVLQLLPVVMKLEENYKYAAILYCINSLLVQFDFSLTEKLTFSQNQFNLFAHEFNVDKSVRQRLADDYRAETKNIKSFMNDSIINEHIYINKVWEINALQIHKSNAVIASIKTKQEPGLILNGIIGSLVHMFVNRAFSSNQRHVEMVLYYRLIKYYSSENILHTISQKTSNIEI